MLPLIAVSAGASVVTGLLNFLAQSSANDRAEALQNKALQEWLKIQIPDPKELRLVLDRFVSEGELEPVLQRAIAQDPSQFEQIVTDSRGKEAQLRALSELESIGNSGGLRLQDRAALQDALQEAQTHERSNRQGIAANMARRGLGGSGFDVAAQLAGQQTTAENLSNSSLKTAALAQERALRAIESAGELGTKYRGQDFAEQSAKASAADRINQFNTQNLRDVNFGNTGILNRSREYNLGNRQKISDRNTELGNFQQKHNKDLIQQNFQNEMQKAAGATQQYKDLGEREKDRGTLQANTISNLGGSISGFATSTASHINNLRKEKEDKEEKAKDRELWREYMARGRG